jgi:hypothetical protein
MGKRTLLRGDRPRAVEDKDEAIFVPFVRSKPPPVQQAVQSRKRWGPWLACAALLVWIAAMVYLLFGGVDTFCPTCTRLSTGLFKVGMLQAPPLAVKNPFLGAEVQSSPPANLCHHARSYAAIAPSISSSPFSWSSSSSSSSSSLSQSLVSVILPLLGLGVLGLDSCRSCCRLRHLW